MKRLWLLAVLIGFAVGSARAQDLQTLINETPDGGTLVVPPGRYVLDGPLEINGKSGFTLSGQGKVQILCSDVWKDVVEISNSNSVRITGIYFSHEKPLKTYECNGGVLSVSNCQKVIIEDCELEGSGTIGVGAAGVRDLHVNHCFIHDNTFNAFYIQDCEEVLLTANVVQDNANFIQLYNSTNFEMSDNQIQRNGGYWRDQDKAPGLRVGKPTTGGKGKK